MNRRSQIWLIVGVVILFIVTIIGETSVNKESESRWIARFQKSLHEMERLAESELNHFEGRNPLPNVKLGKDLIFVCFTDGSLTYWSDKSVGDPYLYSKLLSPKRIQKINGTFYEVLSRQEGPFEYFALIKIKDDKFYTNGHITNQFGDHFNIEPENAVHIKIGSPVLDDQSTIYNRSGIPLFSIDHNTNYANSAISYLIILSYIFVFLSLFHIYSQLMKRAPSIKRQLYYLLGFIIVLFTIRVITGHFEIPKVFYRWSIFAQRVGYGDNLTSIGMLFMTTFSISQIIYITLRNLKIDFQNRWLIKYKSVFIGVVVFIAFSYTAMLNVMIKTLIENSDVTLNLARIVDVDTLSVVAFISVMIGGLGLVIIIENSITLFRNFVDLRTLITRISLFAGILTLISFLTKGIIYWDDAIYVWTLFLIFALSKYRLTQEVQHSIYMLVIFSLSAYIILIARLEEEYKELRMRAEYATALIEENDSNFEHEIINFDYRIKNDVQINRSLLYFDEEIFKRYIKDNVLTVVGYNYDVHIDICYPNHQSGILVPDNCNQRYINLINRYGKRIGNTDFFLIDRFDGKVEYVGVYDFAPVNCYIRLTKIANYHKQGYEHLLSREKKAIEDNVYSYSFGKYHGGKLIASSGDFNYYRDLSLFGPISDEIRITRKAGYSHMIIPAGNSNSIVISMHSSLFRFYYINILYAFFITMLLSSYGLIFNAQAGGRKKTFKRRIKNRVVILILILFTLITGLSIYFNKKTFELKLQDRATEFLGFVRDQLSSLNCVDARICPDVSDVLKQLSSFIDVDINIYTQNGELASTSNEDVYKYGFDGYLINPDVLRNIVESRETSFVTTETIGNTEYLSAYMPLEIANHQWYLINIPYFAQNDVLNRDIIIMIVIAINIAMVVMMIAFVLSSVVAEHITRPLELLNSNLKKMKLDGHNEKIAYKHKDEVGLLVREYNDMVDKLAESVDRLSQSERENAWREMARQIAHEIKNPLTPMRLNIQLLQRAAKVEDKDQFNQRFNNTSQLLIEQIDNLASIASAFSDFARMQEQNNEWFSLSDLVENAALLFEANIDHLKLNISSDISFYGDKRQLNRVLVNLIKNAQQSVPEGQDSEVEVDLAKREDTIEIVIKDNGIGIPQELQKKIFEPNFTTKTSGSGLGLAISKSIISSHKGEILLESSSRGTMFKIILPIPHGEEQEV